MTDDSIDKQNFSPHEGERCIVFADTDTLSSFLWRKSFNCFLKLFQAKGYEICIPQAVIDEMEYNEKTKQELARPIHDLARQRKLKILDIFPREPAYQQYLRFTEAERKGKGESAALSLAIHCERPAAVASNNLRDVGEVVDQYQIELWTTAKIIHEAVKGEILTGRAAKDLWKRMKADGQYLPYETYEEYALNYDDRN